MQKRKREDGIDQEDGSDRKDEKKNNNNNPPSHTDNARRLDNNDHGTLQGTQSQLELNDNNDWPLPGEEKQRRKRQKKDRNGAWNGAWNGAKKGANNQKGATNKGKEHKRGKKRKQGQKRKRQEEKEEALLQQNEKVTLEVTEEREDTNVADSPSMVVKI